MKERKKKTQGKKNARINTFNTSVIYKDFWRKNKTEEKKEQKEKRKKEKEGRVVLEIFCSSQPSG